MNGKKFFKITLGSFVLIVGWGLAVLSIWQITQGQFVWIGIAIIGCG